MPLAPAGVNSIVQCEMHGIVAAGDIRALKSVSVYNFRRTATVLPFNRTSVEAAFQTAICIPVTNCLNNRYTQSFNLVRAINDAQMQNLQVSRAVTGAVAGDAMASTCNVYINFKTGVRAQGLKGSKHLFPMSESQSTAANGDIWNAGALVTFGLLVTAILAGFTDADGNVWVPTVVGRKASQLKKNPTVVSYNDIASGQINKRIAKMNHRYLASEY